MTTSELLKRDRLTRDEVVAVAMALRIGGEVPAKDEWTIDELRQWAKDRGVYIPAA